MSQEHGSQLAQFGNVAAMLSRLPTRWSFSEVDHLSACPIATTDIHARFDQFVFPPNCGDHSPSSPTKLVGGYDNLCHT